MPERIIKSAKNHAHKLSSLLISEKFLVHLPFIVLIFIIFLTNAFHESYPDEFDNILGGWYIIQGKLPYTGFFTHHGPVPYFTAAVITLFTGQSFVAFRIVYAILLASFILWSWVILRRKLGAEETRFYPFFILTLSLLATYYWTHMLLADNVAGLLLTPVYALILIKAVYKKPIVMSDFTFISILSALALYSSLTYAYLYIIIVAFTLFLYLKQFPLNLKTLFFASLKPIALILTPHLVFLIYLLITGSLYDYVYQNFKFNTEFYIYNYPRTPGTSFINPVRFAVVIANSFFNNFHTLLLGVKDFNFVFPINKTMALANVVILIYTLFRRRYALSFFIFLVLIYSNARSNVLESGETDYQSAVYILLSFFNLLFVLRMLFSDLRDQIHFGKKAIYSLLLMLCGIYAFFSLLAIVRSFDGKFYPKYMGTAPLIYNRPRIAPIVNLVTTENDYAWIGPFEFEELFYMDAKIPSKHHILIKGVGVSEKLRNAMNEDFRRTMPKVVYYDENFFYLGSQTKSYAKEFKSFLDSNYITPSQYKYGNKDYKSVPSVDLKLDLETKFFIRKDQAQEVIPILIQNSYLREE